ncbi:ABC transporter permease subunit [Mycoplasma seminis]|uniref:ABC transporter permease n=1 Tax=Mycoplasma seminis TaxID=512749 RepID=A0ABY9HB21_9MOLU|nr:ABC transporter permease [Mycoplasma seminis]WLP85641.1 ABC transporter permease [Mycoplasma seminis]
MTNNVIKNNKQPNTFSKKVVTSLEKTRKYFMFEDKKTNRRKFYSSLWAVFIGLFLANILYFLIGLGTSTDDSFNFFSFFIDIFNFSVSSVTYKNTLIFFIIFAFSGLAVAIGFKSGLFNIGVPGQMLLPGVIFFAVMIGARVPRDDISSSYLIGMFFLSIIVGGLAGGLSGVLKAFFNVHEVISTIFINWIITFLSIWIFTSTNDVLFPTGTPDNFIKQWLNPPFGTGVITLSQQVIDNFIYFGIAFVVLLMLIIWFIYSKTTLGYKIKMIGLNKTNAKYVGINEKLMIILVMFVSGALSGIAGFYYLVIQQKKISLAAAPLNIGFDCIAIALIALNNPIGTVVTSILYAFLNSAQPSFQAVRGISRDFSPIITGLIVFMAALSLMFYSFRPIDWIKKQAVLWFNKEYWENFKIYHKLVKKSHKTKTWEKKEKFLSNEWLENNSKNADSIINLSNIKNNLSIKEFYKKTLKEMKKENSTSNIQELEKEFSQYKEFINSQKKEFNSWYSEMKKKGILNLRKLNKNYYSSIVELRKSNAKLIKDSLNNKELTSDEKQKINIYFDEINKLTTKYEKDYFSIYGSYKNISYKKQIQIAKRCAKVRNNEYKYFAKQYDVKVSKLILSTKGMNAQEKMSIYDEISKLKFDLYKQKEKLGLNQVSEIKNIHKAEKRNSLQVYKALKNRIFNEFHEKHFKTPYHNFVIKYIPMLNEEGEEI